MGRTKDLLLRLDPALAAQLQAVADVEGRPVSEVVREAIRELVAARKADPAFQRTVRQVEREYRKVLDQLKGPQS